MKIVDITEYGHITGAYSSYDSMSTSYSQPYLISDRNLTSSFDDHKSKEFNPRDLPLVLGFLGFAIGYVSEMSGNCNEALCLSVGTSLGISTFLLASKFVENHKSN